MEKRITKNERIEQIKEVVLNANIEEAKKDELIAFLNHEQELINKKNASGGKSEKAQAQLNEIIEILITELAKATEPTTITDLMNNSEVIKNYTYIEGKETKRLSNQKISAIFKQLVDGGKLVKTTNKKKSYFSVAD